MAQGSLALDLTKCQSGHTSRACPPTSTGARPAETNGKRSSSITEPPLEVCPKCGKPTAQRLISAGTGFILKGGGWYSDLYSSAKPGANENGVERYHLG